MASNQSSKKHLTATETAATVSPDPLTNGSSYSTDRMKVSKGIVDELLLVCGVIGTSTSTTTTSTGKRKNQQQQQQQHRQQDQVAELVPVTDCLNWLQDLQRALRRDDDVYRPISLLLSQWKIVEQKLLPLVLSARYDTAIVLTVCKILVILTKPLSDQTLRAGRTAIATQPKQRKTTVTTTNNNGSLKATSQTGPTSIDITKEEEQEQLEAEAKHAAKQLTHKRNQKEVFESVKQEQISIRENAIQQANALVQYKQAFCRNTNHHRTTGAGGGVLSIFVSLLAEPLSRTGNSRTDADHLTIEVVLHLFRNLLSADPLVKTPASENLHHELIIVLERELVLDILHVLAADIERRENAQYNLLLMELFQHLLRHQDPTMVARSQTIHPLHHNQHKTGLLLGSLNRQRNAMKSQATSRHSHFGGVLVVTTSNNNNNNNNNKTKRLLSAGRVDTTFTKAPPVTRKRETFVGVSHRAANHRHSVSAGPTERQSANVIHNFCKRFLETGYGPVMKSLKNEFRRDSVRLEDGDRVVFFHIAWFFCQWWRASRGDDNSTFVRSNTDAGLSVGHLVHTMDLFTFNLVLNATDTFLQHKKYPSMAQAVAVLSEMMHVLYAMYNSRLETERIMALGLMEHLFYSSEPLDRLPKLLSAWSPGMATRDYLCDLLHICHMTLKLLDSFAKECQTKNPDDSVTLSKKKSVAARFQVSSYFSRKIVSNLTVSAFTHLLSSYDANSTIVNHRLIAFFTRLCKHVISMAEASDGVCVVTPLIARTSTYEPLLYNFQMLTVLETILNDTSIRKDNDWAPMLTFASTIAYNFAVNAKKNPMLFVEILLKHPLPHRYCEEVANMYVTDDARLMVERDMLLELQHNIDEKVGAIQQRGEGDDESSDGELEFEDEDQNDLLLGTTDVLMKTQESTNSAEEKKGPKTNDDSSDEEDKDEAKARMERKTKRAKKDQELQKKMQAIDQVDSSDDDDIFGGTQKAALSPKQRPPFWGDSQDE